MPLPEQTISIVDELKKRGFQLDAGERLPYYSLRQGLYEKTGLKPLLGEFTGTSAQNLKLLEHIRNQNVTPQSLGLAPTVPAAPVVPGATSATAALTTAATPQPTRMPTAEELGIPKPLSAQDVLSQIGTIPGTTPEQVLGTPIGGLTYQVAQRKGEEALAAGETAAIAKAEQFGTAGLYFSGARISAEGAERARALSEKMNIDESLAKFIIQQQEAGDKETAQRIQDIVEDAVGANKQARTEAISALGALGYVVMPDGSIILKPSEMRAQEAEARAAAKALEPDTIAIQKEYEYALSQGYTGSFMDYQKFKATQFGTEGAGLIAPSPGFANSKIESSFREDFVALKGQGKTAIENYDTLRTLYSPQEVSDQAIKDMLGIKEELPSPEGIAESWISEIPEYGLTGLTPEMITAPKAKPKEKELEFKFLPGAFGK